MFFFEEIKNMASPWLPLLSLKGVILLKAKQIFALFAGAFAGRNLVTPLD